MTAADKVKLDGIAANANNYTHPTTTAATAAAVKVGKDSSGHVVIGAALTASDIGAATSNHGHNDVTTTAAGFMSVADKVKLNNLGVDFVTYTSADIS